jgi:transcriptional regulator with XRE-family HTH domain
MAKPLAQWRKEKRMKAGQLASKSGVPIQDIVAYEKGETIRLEHLSRLAKALYVDEMDIMLQPPPKPKAPPKPAAPPQAKPTTPTAAESAPAVSETPPQRKKSRWGKSRSSDTKPARESQLEHLLTLAQKQGEDEAAVTTKIGKPLTELSEREAGHWLMQYTESLKLYKAVHREEQEANRPPDTRRRRCKPGKRQGRWSPLPCSMVNNYKAKSLASHLTRSLSNRQMAQRPCCISWR